MQDFDVIIAGGGPAGLLLGKEFSKGFSVLVLEKGKVEETNKNWLTYQDRWDKEGFPKSFIENRFGTWHTQLEYRNRVNEVPIHDKFVCFNEHKFLAYLAEVIRKNNGLVIENSTFKSLKRQKNVLTINGRYRTRLLVDCTGVNSKILKKHRLIDLPIYINCYAYLAEFGKLQNYNFYRFYKHDNCNYSAFGLTKVAPGTAQLQYFEYSNKRLHLPRYERAMKKALIKFKVPSHKVKELKVATYPTGILKSKSLDNIFLFGDAGFFSPSFNGMGFNEILRQHRRVAAHLSLCLKKQKFSKDDLALPDDIADDVNNLIFRFLGMTINDIPLHIFNEFFNAVKSLSEEDVQRVMRNDVTDREVLRFMSAVLKRVNASDLLMHLKKHHVKYIVETLAKLGEDIFTEELENVIFRHHKIRIRDMW